MQNGTYEEGTGTRAATVLAMEGARGEAPWKQTASAPVAGDADARPQTAIVGLRLAMPLAALLWALVAVALWSMLR